MPNDHAVEIYQSKDGETQVTVRFEQESVWLNRHQLAELFGRDVKTIGKHLANVYREGELEKAATVANFATVQTEGSRQVERQIEHYNLDVIISVGYRVKSLQGTQSRIWATQRLKDYLVKGYALNQQRFEKNADTLRQALALIKKAAQSPELNSDGGRGLVEIVSRYTQTFLRWQQTQRRLLVCRLPAPQWPPAQR